MLRLSPSPNVRAAPLVAMSQPFFCILNTMHKILPANGKITDCLSKKEVFSIASSASGSAILHALYANTSYKLGGTSLRAPCLVFLICIFSSQSLYLSANALPRSIASRPAFDCVSSHVRSCLVPRSLKSIGTAAPTHYFRVFKIEYWQPRPRRRKLRWPA